MGYLKLVVKNTIFLFGGKFLSKILSLVYVLLIARYLGPSEYGILTYALTVIGIAALFTDFGFFEVTVRDVARDNLKAIKYINNQLLVRLIFASIIIIFLIIFNTIFSSGDKTFLIINILSLTLIFDSIGKLSNSIFLGLLKIKYIALGDIIKSAVLLSGSVILVARQSDVIQFSVLFLFSAVVVMIYSLLLLFRIGLKDIKPCFNIQFWRGFFKESIYFWIYGVFIIIYNRVDAVMIYYFRGSLETGLYDAAHRLTFGITLFPVLLMSAIFPVMSKQFVESSKSLAYSFKFIFKIVTYLVFPIVIIIIGFSNEIITFLYGHEYAESAIPLSILAIALFFVFPSLLISTFYNTINKQIFVAKVTFYGLIFNVITNLIFIPKYGMIGASYTTLLTELIVFYILFSYLNKSGFKVEFSNLKKEYFKAFLPGFAILIPVILMNSYFIYIAVPGLILYSIGLYHFGFEKGEKDKFKLIYNYKKLGE